MDSGGCVFLFPLETESEERVNYEEETLVVMDGRSPTSEKKDEQPLPPRKEDTRQSEPQKRSPLYLLRFTWRMIKWHILIFIVITTSLYAAFHFGVKTANKKTILDSIAFINDWRLLVFFLGIYLSFSVKKISDISSVS
jgi:hypothetical protein